MPRFQKTYKRTLIADPSTLIVPGDLKTGDTQTVSFERVHSHEANTLFDIHQGIPYLEALELINKWNTWNAVISHVHTVRWLYWID